MKSDALSNLLLVMDAWDVKVLKSTAGLALAYEKKWLLLVNIA